MYVLKVMRLSISSIGGRDGLLIFGLMHLFGCRRCGGVHIGVERLLDIGVERLLDIGVQGLPNPVQSTGFGGAGELAT